MNPILQHLAMQGIPIVAQQEQSGPLEIDAEVRHTRSQLETLWGLINNVESLTKVPDRPDDNEGPTVPVSDEQSQDAAAAIILHASNRIISILEDDARWKKLAKPKAQKGRCPNSPEKQKQA